MIQQIKWPVPTWKHVLVQCPFGSVCCLDSEVTKFHQWGKIKDILFNFKYYSIDYSHWITAAL